MEIFTATEEQYAEFMEMLSAEIPTTKFERLAAMESPFTA